MSIMDYVARKKEDFKNKAEARKTKQSASRMKKLEELELKRRVLEQDAKIQRDLNREEEKIRSLKKEKLRNSLAGRVFSNVKAKYKEEKSLDKGLYAGNSGSIFTQKPSYDNPFSAKSGANNFNKGSFSSPYTKGSIGRNPFSKGKK